ncbi:MAG: asparagine synthetase B [Magnetococcales bacterium]|nr:asparagine synthetase B [Magnetococcales bacterium]HIJ84316.1 amidotransferase 1, exosortase A system-associated [Magnetococcales bacterium]
MCGIVGLFDLTGQREPDRSVLARMNQSQRHRGPDAEGIHIAPGIGLGHRRLSIIDLEGGRQPLFNEDGQIAVVFNGEIYNFQALAKELTALGHRFNSRSDTEILVHGWEAWGPGLTERLQGMFAFAIHDNIKKNLFLARDPLGIKPLHYAILKDGWLAFASELKGITTHPRFERILDPQAVECYFALGYVPDPLTLFAGAHKLPPGHRLEIKTGQPLRAPECYWDLAFEPCHRLGRQEAREELLLRLRQSVQSHMVADVELAAFLSGGVDSSAIAVLMAQSQAAPVTACTVSFADPAFDETRWATQVAQRHGLTHVVEQAEPHHFHLMDRLAYHHDEPFADHSSLPTWMVCAMARKRVKVVLSGDGGDESLAGYERYRFVLAEEKIKSFLPQGLRRMIFGPLGWFYPKGDRLPRFLRAKSTLQSLAKDSIDGYFQAVAIMPWELRKRLYSQTLRTSLQGYRAEEVFRQLAPRAPDHPLARMQYLDFKTFLAGRVLTKVDRASMAHGLEVRVPLLDHELVQWMVKLPADFKIFHGQGKALFKEGLVDLLGPELLNRPKMGFVAPIAQWLRQPLAGRLRELAMEPRLVTLGGMDRKFLEWMIGEHLRGRRNFSQPLWAVMQFDACLKNAFP